MLASTAADVGEAFAKIASRPCSVDTKLDGIRIQVHKQGADVSVFTRSLDDITSRLPEAVTTAQALPVDSVILDGEAILVDASGRPRPFQETASHTSTQQVRSPKGVTRGLRVFFFDCLHVDGVDLIDEPLSVRLDRLDRLLPAAVVVPRLVTADRLAAQQFFAQAVAAGQEGVVVKASTAPYDAGRRGAGWVKVKPRAHPRPRGARRRVGQRQTSGAAVEHPPRRPRQLRRLRHARQDVQGHDGRDACLADRTLPLAGGVAGRSRREKSDRSKSSRSPSTGCSARRATPAGWR